jgi:hypothetical protein
MLGSEENKGEILSVAVGSPSIIVNGGRIRNWSFRALTHCSTQQNSDGDKRKCAKGRRQ